MKTQAVTKPKRPCVLRSVVVGSRRLIIFESFLHVLGREADPTDPITITKQKAVELSGLSIATIERMITAGAAEMAEAA